MLFLIETEQVQKNIYVVEADPPFTETDASAKLEVGEIRDFSQRYQGEKITSFERITTSQYIQLFDETYPDMKDLDRTSKLLQISDVNDSVIMGEVDRDEL